MQILIFSFLILALVAYIIYRIKKSFSKKEALTLVGLVVFSIFTFIYYNNVQENKLPNAFKAKYLNEKSIEIQKISYTQTNIEILSSTKGIYDFVYIINKNSKEYVCEAKDVEAQKIEDEYVFKNYKEECRLK